MPNKLPEDVIARYNKSSVSVPGALLGDLLQEILEQCSGGPAAPAAQGPAGPVGPQGPAGPVGPQGPAGAAAKHAFCSADHAFGELPEAQDVPELAIQVNKGTLLQFEAWLFADKKTADFKVVSNCEGTLHSVSQVFDSAHMLSGVFFCDKPGILKVSVQSATKSLTVSKGSFLRVSTIGSVR